MIQKFIEIPNTNIREEVTNNNPLGFNDEELQFSAEVLAQQRFEDLAQ